MSGIRYHISVSVKGSLRQSDSELAGLVTLDDGQPATGHQARQWLRIQQMKGRKVLPVGEPCEGFSYETGCPGHSMAGDAERLGIDMGARRVGQLDLRDTP